MLIVALIAAYIASWLANVDQYRPQIIESIESAIDRPASIGELTLSVLPVPCVTAHDIRIGNDSLYTTIEEVTLYTKLLPLLKKEAHVTSVRIHNAAIHLPEAPEDIRREINAIEYTSSGKGKWSVTIDRVYAPTTSMYLGTSDQPALTGAVDVRDLLETDITVHVDTEVPIVGADARLDGDLHLTLQPGQAVSVGIQGNARLRDIDTTTLVRSSALPPSLATIEAVDILRTNTNAFTFSVKGESAPTGERAQELRALAGTFTASAAFSDGAFTLRDLAWRAPGLEFDAEVATHNDGSFTSLVKHGAVSADGIKAFFVLNPVAAFTIQPDATAKLTVTNLTAERDTENAMRFVRGDIAFNGVNLVVEDGAKAYSGFSGEATIDDGTILIDRLSGEGITIQGTVIPNLDTGETVFDVSAKTELTRERLMGMVSSDAIQSAGGTITLQQIKGTVKPGEGVPADLYVEGTLTGGHLTLDTPQWPDTFRDITAHVEAQTGAIETRITAVSDTIGDIKCNGVYALDARQWKGTVTGDVSKIDLPSVEGATREVALGILDAYALSTFNITAVLPSPNQKAIVLHVMREGTDPALTSNIVFAPSDDGWTMGRLDIAATIPSQTITPMLSEGMRVTGPMDVQFSQSIEQERFNATIDLARATAYVGTYLTKQPGDVFQVAVGGAATEDLWETETIDIGVLGETIRGRLDGARFLVDALDLDVAALAPLLPEGGTAHGRITGNVATEPTAARLDLNNIGFALSPELAIDSVNGPLILRDGYVTCDGLTIRGANSDCVLNARRVRDEWRGDIKGSQLDLNALDILIDAYNAFQAEGTTGETGTATTTESAEPFVGQFAVDLDSLLYRRARVERVKGTLVATGTEYLVRDFSFRPYSGSVEGMISYTLATEPGGEGRFIADMTLDGADLRLIDEVAFPEPRNLQGAMTGKVFLEMPIGEAGARYDGINGRVEFSGRNGSLGSLGMADKVLWALRTTELLHGRMSFKDSGLSYDTINGSADIRNGVIQLNTIVLERPAYRMTTIGSINLPAWQTEALVHVQLIEKGLTDLVKVNEYQDIEKKGGIRILLTGPPDEPDVKMSFGGPVDKITDEVIAAMKTTGDLFGDLVGGAANELIDKADDIVEGASDLIRGILGQ